MAERRLRYRSSSLLTGGLDDETEDLGGTRRDVRWHTKGRGALEGYTAAQACQLTSCTPHQLRYWDKVGLVKPSIQTTDGRPGRRRIYSFRDLVGLRVVKSLLDNGLSIQRVRRAWDYLRRTGDMDDQLSDVKLVTDGQTIFAVAHDDAELMDALRQGQLAFFVKIDEIAQDVEEDVTKFELDRDDFREMIRRVEDDVMAEASDSASG